MSSPVRPEFVEHAGRLTAISRPILRRYYRQKLDIIDKADESPVTRADRECEAAIRQAINAAFPDHGIIGEEYGAERADAEFVWVLDPLDGTRAFITGRPTFGTLIALTSGRHGVGEGDNVTMKIADSDVHVFAAGDGDTNRLAGSAADRDSLEAAQ